MFNGANAENHLDDDINSDVSHKLDDEETYIHLEIAKYICRLNLDKFKTNQLLSLLNQVHDQPIQSPLSSISLWKNLNIEFKYTTFTYCPNCIFELTECSCSTTTRLIPSKLIVFTLSEEITRVVKSNYDMILKYKHKHHENQDDIV